MKTYLKDLTPEEVIRRLKAGEVVRFKGTTEETKYIDGFVCTIYSDKVFTIDSGLAVNDGCPAYFETPDELKLEVGKCYKTRDGRKAFISSYNSSTKYFKGVVVDFLNLAVWTENRLYLYATESGLDLISEWSDDNE